MLKKKKKKLIYDYQLLFLSKKVLTSSKERQVRVGIFKYLCNLIMHTHNQNLSNTVNSQTALR